MDTKLVIFLLIGTGAMLIPIALLSWKYQLRMWKSIPISFLLTVAGTLGVFIWFFVENGYFSGRSFFGAVFLVPILFLPVAKMLRVDWGELLDLCAPAECVMLAIMKYQCTLDGCCGGRTLYVKADGSAIQFPSQVAELVNAALIFLTLVVLAFILKKRGTLYPWYLVIYGGSRFILNFFRMEWEQYSGGIPPLGTVWSVCAIIIGVIWLRKIWKRMPSGVQMKDDCTDAPNIAKTE